MCHHVSHLRLEQLQHNCLELPTLDFDATTLQFLLRTRLRTDETGYHHT